MTHKAAAGVPLEKKRGFVHPDQVVTESHDLFLDRRDGALTASHDYIYET